MKTPRLGTAMQISESANGKSNRCNFICG